MQLVWKQPIELDFVSGDCRTVKGPQTPSPALQTIGLAADHSMWPPAVPAAPPSTAVAPQKRPDRCSSRPPKKPSCLRTNAPTGA